MAQRVPTAIEAPRQTLGYIRSRLDEHGIQPKSKLGQNFLIDLNLLDVLLEAAEISNEDLVLEVGCGTGSLTSQLAALAGAVLAIEVDPALHPLAQELLREFKNVRLLRADALKTKNELNPLIFAELAELTARFLCKRFKLVANLPYAVATPVIANLLLSDWVPERMVVTVQWEIAARLTAPPQTPHYGALAVLVQSLADVQLLRKLPPAVFWPRPQVDSAMVLIRPDAAKRANIDNPLAFRNFLRDLYSHKRKSIRSALIGWPTGRKEKPWVDQLLSRLNLLGTIRAEELSWEKHLELCRAFCGIGE